MMNMKNTKIIVCCHKQDVMAKQELLRKSQK